MSGSTPRWDQPPDPRESTVDLPRVVDPQQSSLQQASSPQPSSPQPSSPQHGRPATPGPERADRARFRPGEPGTAARPATFPAALPVAGPYLTAADLRARYPHGLRLPAERLPAERLPAERLPADDVPPGGPQEPELGHLAPLPAVEQARDDDARRDDGLLSLDRAPGPLHDRPVPQDYAPSPQEDRPVPQDDWAGPRDYRPVPQDYAPSPQEDRPVPQDDSAGPRDYRPVPQDYAPSPQDRPVAGSLGDLLRRARAAPGRASVLSVRG